MYDDIRIEARCWEPQHGLERKITAWAVVQGGFVWTKRNRWEVEPTPSSRTPAFLKRSRYNTLEEAVEAARGAMTRPLGRFQDAYLKPESSK